MDGKRVAGRKISNLFVAVLWDWVMTQEREVVYYYGLERSTYGYTYIDADNSLSFS